MSVCDGADDHDEALAWDKLVTWLIAKGMDKHILVHGKRVPGAGRGLFTTADVPPNTPLFNIPESAHLNSKTLAPLYGKDIAQALTATQIISMHIFLHRPSRCHGAEYTSTDPAFGPYISVLPEDFEGHPLSWVISAQQGMQGVKFFLTSLPPAANRALQAMEIRFWEDWNMVSQLMREYPNIAASSRRADLTLSPFVLGDHVQTYLWAWLNVNTRCVYHRIFASVSDPNNITLCPLLDFANHNSLSAYTPSSPPIPVFSSPLSRAMSKGDEVYLRYGPHSNIRLFTEYGFVEPDSENGGQADVQDILETLFQQQGAAGELMKATLESVNYWGNWTLHDAPAPAHPSFRILPPLRLMQLSMTRSADPISKEAVAESRELAVWHGTLLGEADIVSPENEKGVWEQLLAICEIVATRAEEAIDRLQRERDAHVLPGWRRYAVEAIETLWHEEQRVARAVMQSIKDGEQMD